MVLKIGKIFSKTVRKSLVPLKNQENNPWSRIKFGKRWKNNNNNNNNYDIQVLGIGAASKNRSWLALGRISLVDSSTHSRVFL